MSSSLRILYIDDSAYDRDLVRDALLKENPGEFLLTMTSSRSEFETKLTQEKYDLVLSDFNILGFDGLQVLDLVKQADGSLPVIIVTGTGNEEVAVEAMKRGAGDYVIKSHSHIQHLPQTIRTVLEKRSLEIERQKSNQQIQRQLARLTALRTIDTSINSSFNLQTTLDVILEQTVTQLGVDAAIILLFNPQTRTLEYAASRGINSASHRQTKLHLGDEYAGRAALEHSTINIPNIIEDGGKFAKSLLSGNDVFMAYYGAPLIVKGQIKGVLEILQRTALNPDEEWLAFLDTLAGQAAITIDNIELFESLQRSNIELASAYDTTLLGWSHALDLRDKETEGHTERVVQMTLRLAHLMNVGEGEMEHIRRGALLHDIGKLGIPDSILLKPEPLTPAEWDVMHLHPVYAFEWLKPISFLQKALDIPYCHHEKWDSSGYPRGLKGEEIPLAARIFAITDVWDALVNDRPYRLAWTEEKAFEYIQEQKGKYFDPQVVKAFFILMKASSTDPGLP